MIHTRHQALFDASQQVISLIGAGGIGAITAVTLAKMGVGILDLYDDDRIDAVNLATQFHLLSDVGKPKVSAVKDLAEAFGDDTAVSAFCQRVGAKEEFATPLVISAVDSINARKDIWAAVCHSPYVRWYLDARMAAEEFHLYTVDMSDHYWYTGMIFDQDEDTVAEIPCTAKATIFCADFAAGVIGSTVRKIATGIRPPKVFVFNLITNALTIIP